MPAAVFLSYSRSASGAEAQALYRELGEDLAFLDTSDIEAGEQFPAAFTGALLNSRVVVIFASPAYFQSWYCLRELRTALVPYDALLRRPGATSDQLARALRRVIVALPKGAANPQLEKLPPALAMENALPCGDTGGLAAMVRLRLEEIKLPLRDELAGAEANRILEGLVEEAAIPPPASLAGLKVYHRQGSLGLSLESNFVGRANDLWRIQFELSTLRGDPSKSAVSNVLLHSGGGYGKTRVALEYTLRYGPRYFSGGLFWIDANTGAGGLEEQFFGILQVLKPDVPDLSALRKEGLSVGNLLRQELSKGGPQPVLFIIDDIPESSPGEKPMALRELCPAIGLVSVLATSRQSVREPGVIEIWLDCLSTPASILLLKEGLEASEGLPEQDWRDLAELVGGLPLALDLLNKLIVTGAYPAQKVLQRIRTASLTVTLDSASEALQGQFAGAALRGITEAFSVSFEKLDTPSQFVACILARFAPMAIPEALMENLSEDANAPAIRSKLRLRHIITGHAAGIFGVVHRVFADYLRAQYQQHQQDFLLGACRAVGGLMTIERCQDPKEWPLLNLCRSHAEHLFQRVPQPGAAEELLRWAVYLGTASGVLLYWQGDYSGAERVQRMVLETARQRLGQDDSATLGEMSNLGLTLAQTGQLKEAHQLQQVVVQKRLKELGPDHEDTLVALHSYAWSLNREGNYAEARQLQEHVLRGWLQMHGEQHPHTIAALSNLADTLVGQGELAQARVLQEAVLNSLKQLKGEESSDTLAVMCSLGKTLRRLHETQASIDILRTAQDIGQRCFGAEHPITLLAGTNLGAALLEARNLKEARQVQGKVLETLRQKYGLQHPETLTAINNLATALYRSGEYDQAKTLQEELVQARTQLQGLRDPLTISAVWDLALTLFIQKDYPRACELYQLAYRCGKLVHGIAHEDSISIGSDLIVALQTAGDAKASEAVARELRLFDQFKTSAAAAPAGDTSTLEELILKARERRAAGDRTGALESISLALKSALGGPETRLLGETLTTLGTIHLAGHSYDQACDAFDGARIVFHDLDLAEQEWTAEMWIGQCAQEAGQTGRAIAALESAYEKAKAAQNWEDANTCLRQLTPLYAKAVQRADAT